MNGTNLQVMKSNDKTNAIVECFENHLIPYDNMRDDHTDVPVEGFVFAFVNSPTTSVIAPTTPSEVMQIMNYQEK